MKNRLLTYNLKIQKKLLLYQNNHNKYNNNPILKVRKFFNIILDTRKIDSEDEILRGVIKI